MTLLICPMPLDYHYAESVKRLRYSRFEVNPPSFFPNTPSYLWHIGQVLSLANRHSSINKTHWIALAEPDGLVIMSVPGAMPLGH